MSFSFFVPPLLLGALAVNCVLFCLVPWLRRHMVDYPNYRSSHRLPTPRGGGIAFLVVAVVSSIVALMSHQGSAIALLPLLASPLSIVGLVDDRFSLPVSWRYCFQILTASFLLSFSSLLSRFQLNLLSDNWLFFPLFLVLAILISAVINFTNFMDGLDGLVAGCMAVSFFALALFLNAPWPLWVLVGSLFGFLFWNWSPAKVFMGDVGSTFLGAIFAGFVLQASNWAEAFGCLLIATPLLADACLCVLRRFFAGQRVFKAHRLHLFQRLHQAGWSHARVSLTYIAATAVLGLAMLAGGWPWVFGLAVAELLVGVWLDHRVAVPFALASKS